MSKKEVRENLARKAQEEFTDQLQELLSIREPKQIINTLDSILFDWISTEFADDRTTREEITITMVYLTKMIKSLDTCPDVACKVVKNLQKSNYAV